MDSFSDDLLELAMRNGTILKVAQALEVEPAQIYRWIGGLRPADRERSLVVARLKQLKTFGAYFDRRARDGGGFGQATK